MAQRIYGCLVVCDVTACSALLLAGSLADQRSVIRHFSTIVVTWRITLTPIRHRAVIANNTTCRSRNLFGCEQA
jgi:hypothetical protein